jgi:hypothetical protein
MITVKKDGIILEKTTLIFESEGVLNPAAIREGAFVHIFYSVSEGNHSNAADERIACASMSLSGLVKELMLNEK